MIVTAADRAAAALDRHIRHTLAPARGAQIAHAMVDGMLRSINNGPVQQRIAQVVRTMR